MRDLKVGGKKIFRIKVIKWNEHNAGHKRTYKKTQIRNNFCTDAKIVSLPLAARWLFLGILLECGDSACDTITMSERHVNELLTIRLGASNALDRLQSLQLLSYEVLPLLKERSKEVNLPPEGPEVNDRSIVDPKPDPKSGDAIASPSKKQHASHFIKVENAEHLLAIIPKEARSNLMTLYCGDQEFLSRETLKIVNWLIANPKKNHRTVKGWVQFVSGWLERGWTAYQKTIPTNRPMYRTQQQAVVEE